ncbi:ATP-binding protein, partial [Ruminococcus sp. AF42-10]
IDKVKELQIKYENRNNDIKTENDYIEKVARVIDRISKKHDRSISDRQKRETAFWDNSTELVQKIINIIKLKEELPSYVPYIEETQISPHCNMIHTYEFVSKLKIDEINTEYFISCINKVIKSKKKIDWKTITESKLKEMLLRYDGSTPVLSFFKEALLSVIENDFQNKQTIINCGMDKFTELSSGLDAQIYFDLLSYEKTQDGVYIIDQPEDNVSQKAIKTYLLDCFRTMGKNRQVIMVTHNPQFIVNLDVDNIIYISKKQAIL